MSDKAARVRLDVRWDPGTLEVARVVAEGRNVRVGVVMRQAVEIGLSTLVNGEGGAGGRVVGDLGAVTSVAVGTLPGAGSASSRAPVAVDDPPSVGGHPARSSAGTRLEAVVARLMPAPVAAGGDVAIDRLRAGVASRAPAPADLATARRKVLRGEVLVGGGVCRNPVQLVDPLEVGLS